MIADNTYRTYKRFRGMSFERKKIDDKRRQRILSRYTLSGKQKKMIDELYLRVYGKKIPYDWHRYYSSYTGNFDVNYIPELFFIPVIQRKMVLPEYVEVFTNKDILPLLVDGIDGIRTANIYLSCVEGIYRNKEMQFITKNEAVVLLSNLGKAFVKPTKNSSSGLNCSVVDFYDGVDNISNKTAEEVLNSLGKNFNVQELLVNCESVKRLHPQSINTMRITTYIWKNKIWHFPMLLRIGIGGNNVDNAHAGGIFVGINDDGTMKECAFTEFQKRYQKHPDTGICFKDYVIPETPKMLEAAKKLHQRIPQVGMISWDVIIDDKGNVVIIEMNLRAQSVWLPQMAHGVGAFGKNTEDILKWAFKK